MSALRGQLADYLAVRRALGYRLGRQEKLLGQFLDYLEDRGLEQITIEHALRWATLPAGAPRWHANRLCAVRGFARHLKAIGMPVEAASSKLGTAANVAAVEEQALAAHAPDGGNNVSISVYPSPGSLP